MWVRLPPVTPKRTEFVDEELKLFWTRGQSPPPPPEAYSEELAIRQIRTKYSPPNNTALKIGEEYASGGGEIGSTEE